MSKRKLFISRRNIDWSWETKRSDFSFGCDEQDMGSQLRRYLEPGMHNLARSVCILALSAGVATAASAKQPTSDDWSRQLVITANPAIHSVITADIDKALDTTPTLREVSLIDGNLSDLETLVTAARQRGDVYVIRTDVDGVEAATRILAGYSGLDAVHIFSHGSAGHFNLGNAVVEASTLTFHEESFAAWSKSLTESADILVYGCNVGSSPAGKALLSSLSEMTGADIAGSTDVTGALALEGDWTLEVAVGSIETPVFGAPAWEGAMVAGRVVAGDGSGGGGSGGFYGTYTYGYSGGDGGDGGGSDDIQVGTQGDDIMFGDGSGGGGGGALYGGAGGSGGSGSDNLHGGFGNDIIFGDGFDGNSGDSDFNGGVGGFGGGGGGGGAGNITGAYFLDICNGGAGGIGGGGGGGGDYGDGGNGGFGGGGGGGGGWGYWIEYGGGSYGGADGGFASTPGASSIWDAGGGGGGGGFFGIGALGGAAGTGILAGLGGSGGGSGIPNSVGSDGGGGGSDWGPGGGGGGFSFLLGFGAGGGSVFSNGTNGDDADTVKVFIDDNIEQTIYTAVKQKVDAGDLTALPGGAGNDILDGGPGSDDLFGMGGSNTFFFEMLDAMSGSDVDTIHGWADGTNLINIQVDGESIDAASVTALIAAQTPNGIDRAFAVTNGVNPLVIVVKGIATDLVPADFITGTASVSVPIPTTWYADDDNDGFGDPLDSLSSVLQPAGYVADNTDCNDAEAASFPGNIEIIDSIDNNCDGVVDALLDDPTIPTTTDTTASDSSGSGKCFIGSLLD